MNGGKIFFYGELQMTVPLADADWHSINAGLKKVPRFVRKTWLIGVQGRSVEGFSELDSEENAQSFAVGPDAEKARQ